MEESGRESVDGEEVLSQALVDVMVSQEHSNRRLYYYNCLPNPLLSIDVLERIIEDGDEDVHMTLIRSLRRKFNEVNRWDHLSKVAIARIASVIDRRVGLLLRRRAMKQELVLDRLKTS